MDKPIIIATLMRQDGETGVQTHVRSLVDYLAGAGHGFDLVTPYSAPRWQVYPVFALRRLIDPVHRSTSVWWYRHWHAVFLFRALRRRLADGSPCIVYAQCPVSAAAALRARASPAQRVALVVHFNVSQADEWADKGAIARGGRLFRAIRALEAATLPRLDGLVYVSRFMRALVEQNIGGLAPIPAAVLPNFLPAQAARAAGAPAQPAGDLISIGTLEPRKNQGFLLQVLAAAARAGHSYTLDVVGDGPDRGSLRDLANALGVGGQVRFLGFQAGAAGLIAGHRAYVHAARVENLPLSLIEGLRAGIPLFAAPVGGVPEVFDDGVEGRFWDLEDPGASAKILCDTLSSEAGVRRMGEAARARFAAEFSSAAVGRRLLEFLLTL